METLELIKRRFSEIEETWKELYNNNDHLSPYSSYEFAECYRRYFHLGFIRVIMKQEFFIAKSNDMIIAIIPLINYGKDYYIYGDMCASGYLDFIYNKNISKFQIDELFECLKHTLKKKNIHLNKINERSILFPYLREHTNETALQICVNIPFGNNYDEYFRSLGKSIKQNIRTAYNRMNREGREYQFKIYLDNTVTTEIIDKEMEIYHKREEHRNKKNTPMIIKKIRQKFNPISISTNQMKTAVHACFYIDNELASFLSGYITNDGAAIVVPRHAINDKYSVYCAGALLITETIKYCIENTTIRNIDLSRGDEKYKYTLGGVSHYNHSFIISTTK